MRHDIPCSVDGCDKPGFCRGWCSMHYTRWQKFGDVHYVTPRSTPGPCGVDGCARVARTRGLCNTHYLRLIRHGEVGEATPRLFARRPTAPEESFWARVNQHGPIPASRPDLGPCWIWTGALSHGYGRMTIATKSVAAHRFAYILLVGPIPVGTEPDHLCVNPPCVNPRHLEPVTHQENMLRGPTNVAGRNARKTHCPQAHEYTEANTMRRPNGDRQCRECNRVRCMEYYQRKKVG